MDPGRIMLVPPSRDLWCIVCAVSGLCLKRFRRRRRRRRRGDMNPARQACAGNRNVLGGLGQAVVFCIHTI